MRLHQLRDQLPGDDGMKLNQLQPPGIVQRQFFMCVPEVEYEVHGLGVGVLRPPDLDPGFQCDDN